ncbi:hypothetical protein OPV22_000499 [Ensete ventricosum]|uniref:Uncharacterized protein n=1 Tax=Ensete ventricosum TaxID=4639 RepID=A0AAV8QAX5_ENSVE|nr:hypothetical protein OPV22_000499 [Ensete ventricosum]
MCDGSSTHSSEVQCKYQYNNMLNQAWLAKGRGAGKQQKKVDTVHSKKKKRKERCWCPPFPGFPLWRG